MTTRRGSGTASFALITTIGLLLGPQQSVTAGTDPGAVRTFQVMKTAFFNQGPGGVTGNDYEFSVLVEASHAYDQASLAYPGAGSPQAIPPAAAVGSLFELHQSFATRAGLDAAYPAGTYTTTVSNSQTAASTSRSISFARDAYPSAVPKLSASTFQSLQGLNPARAFHLSFNTFAPDTLSEDSFTFLSIAKPATASTLLERQLAADAGGYELAANTLAPNTQYLLNLVFVNSVDRTVDQEETRFSEYFDTEVTFTTGAALVVVAEPGCLTLAGVALAAAYARRRRRPE